MEAAKKQKQTKLERLGINNNHDLIHYYPRKYEKRYYVPVGNITGQESAVIKGTVDDYLITNPRPGLKIMAAKISDETGTIKAKWFRTLPKINIGDKIIVYGNVKYGLLQEILVKDYVFCQDGSIPEDFNGIVPVYSLKKGISQKYIRKKIRAYLGKYETEEFLPEDIRKTYKLPGIETSLINIHFPADSEGLRQARRRLAFDELFLMQVALRLKKDAVVRKPKQNRYLQNNKLINKFIKTLDFVLTDAQAREWKTINSEMSGPFPMRRLLLGDVGSGKTVLAALGLLKSVESNLLGILMAPTEVLAVQHCETLKQWFGRLGEINVALFTSGKKDDINKANIVVGTHALIQEKLDFKKNVGLVVVDEQHRFGVAQRIALQEKAGCPDMLFTTATPIPRTLALACYGDMDISYMDEMPAGRIPPQTFAVRNVDKTLKTITNELRKGRQCYVICPLVEESEKIDLQSAITLHEELSSKLRPYTVGLVHGRMKSCEKNAVMEGFKNNKIAVLVSTTVVEVGVNVPNATVMVIIDADRFGLAQLHQLRGRIGRSTHKSCCLLVCNPKTETAVKRINAMLDCTDGAKLAGLDLKLRGPGEFFGEKQSGLMNLKIADLDNVNMLAAANKTAQSVFVNQKLLKELARRYKLYPGY